MDLSWLGVFLGYLAVWEGDFHCKRGMRSQEHLLKKIIRKNKNTEYGKKYNFKDIKTIEDFQNAMPLTTAKDYEEYVDRMVHNREKKLITASIVTRYCSSSGSVGKPKILPKTSFDLWNMQCLGFSGTVARTHQYFKQHNLKFPKQLGLLVMVLTGHKLEDNKMCNGAAQIPISYLKPIVPFFSTTPLDILYPEKEELLDVSYFQLRLGLLNRDVSYIGSVVVTLVTNMFDYLENNWQMICDDIENGTINASVKCPPEIRKKYEKKFKPDPKRAAELRKEFEKGFEDPIAPRIWPKLAWAYGMAGSNLLIYVEKLRKYIGDIPMFFTGYAAAEGYFTLPVSMNTNDGALMPHCVFFEFLPLDAPEGMTPITMDKLEVGKDYEVIVTNSSGLYRYRMEDVVRVKSKYHNSFAVELLYRMNLGMNIANEKTSTKMIDWCVSEMSKEMGMEFKGHSCYEDYSIDPPRYTLFVEPLADVTADDKKKAADILDAKMKECNEKYFKYRRWGMIADPEVYFLKKESYSDYNKMLISRGVVLNQVKPVTIINNEDRKNFFFSHIDI